MCLYQGTRAATEASPESEQERGGLLLPRHSRERFGEFLKWVAADVQRARHLETVARAAGVFVPETRLADWTADAEVAAVLRRLIEERGVPSQ